MTCLGDVVNWPWVSRRAFENEIERGDRAVRRANEFRVTLGTVYDEINDGKKLTRQQIREVEKVLGK